MVLDRRLAMCGIGVAVAIGARTAVFIWPNHREARAIRGQIRDLQVRIDGLDGRAAAVDRLAGCIG